MRWFLQLFTFFPERPQRFLRTFFSFFLFFFQKGRNAFYEHFSLKSPAKDVREGFVLEIPFFLFIKYFAIRRSVIRDKGRRAEDYYRRFVWQWSFANRTNLRFLSIFSLSLSLFILFSRPVLYPILRIYVFHVYVYEFKKKVRSEKWDRDQSERRGDGNGTALWCYCCRCCWCYCPFGQLLLPPATLNPLSPRTTFAPPPFSSCILRIHLNSLSPSFNIFFVFLFPHTDTILRHSLMYG